MPFSNFPSLAMKNWLAKLYNKYINKVQPHQYNFKTFLINFIIQQRLALPSTVFFSKTRNIINKKKKVSEDYFFLTIFFFSHLFLVDGLEVTEVKGMFYLPIFNKWCWIEDTSVNFALNAIKPNISVTPPEVTLDTQTNDTNTW